MELKRQLELTKALTGTLHGSAAVFIEDASWDISRVRTAGLCSATPVAELGEKRHKVGIGKRQDPELS